MHNNVNNTISYDVTSLVVASCSLLQTLSFEDFKCVYISREKHNPYKQEIDLCVHLTDGRLIDIFQNVVKILT